MKTGCFALLAIVVLVTLSVAACGQQPTPAVTQAPTVPPKPTEKVATPIGTQAPTVAPKATEKVATPTGKPAWQADWEATLAGAKKEGKVVIYATVGQVVREAIAEAFKKQYGIEIEFLAGRGADIVTKLLRERSAGLYLADVFLGGSTTIITSLKPEGALEPLRPLLVLPEVTDEKAYFRNKLPFIDKEGLVSGLMASVVPNTSLINTDLVKEGELNSYFDLLQPKWKGKLVMNDPTITGRGESFFSRIAYAKTLDAKFWADLLKQEPVITRDERAQVESVAKGKYPVGWATDDNNILVFKKAGAPIKEIRFKEDPLCISSPENTGLLTNAPNKNAQKVFLNWLLSKEGQAIHSRAAERQGIRLDAPTDHLTADSIRLPGVEYFVGDSEEFILWRGTEGNKLAKQIFGPALGR